MKTVLRVLCIATLFILSLKTNTFAQYFYGKVIGSTELKPLPGASVRLKESLSGTLSDSAGNFRIGPVQKGDIIMVSYLGFQTAEYKIDRITDNRVEILLEEDGRQLETVIISTGYQKTSLAQATGSVVNINKKLFNRRVSTDVLSRLEDVVPGLIFRRGKGAYTNAISIRGRSTIQGNTAPLIVIDNFPFEGDINSINPNDIETVTVLKDAAASSIWGARAGNGVIVITTTNANAGKIKVSLNSNVTVSEQPDLFYRPRMSSSDFIDIEKMLFERGYYRSSELSPAKAALSPAVELMIAGRDGQISSEEMNRSLDALRSIDIRNEMDQYLYRGLLNQQYALNVSGGTEENRFYFSLGLDKNKAYEVRNDFNRISFSGRHSYRSKDRKLEINTGVYYTHTDQSLNNQGAAYMRMNTFTPIYPYAKMADENGTPQSTVYMYRASFAQDAVKNGLLDWEYRPLDELYMADNTLNSVHYRGNFGLKYKLFGPLSAEAIFQYAHDEGNLINLYSTETFFTRDLINNYTQVDADGRLVPAIPKGDIKDRAISTIENRNLRGQLNYNETFSENHRISALLGYEIRENDVNSFNARAYGYNSSVGTQQPVDYGSNYRFYYYPQLLRKIPFEDTEAQTVDRFISNYFSGNYMYGNKYVLSASARFDRSNLIGVKNQGVPLWSAGAGWNIHEESFYKSELIRKLKVRAAFGYNGNVHKSVTALTTAIAGGVNALTGLPSSSITNPPNPSLRWERVKIINAGLDFELGNQILNGSLDIFTKQGIDLISPAPLAPSTGITTLTGNTANTSGKGFDLTLHSNNIRRKISWSTDIFLSYITEKVAKYHVKSTATNYVQSGDGIGILPLEGKPLYAVYSYEWSGLDPQTGDPLGILEGAPSKAYSTIISSAKPESLIYHGSAIPKWFGAIRNSVEWKGLSLSANVSYRLGYFFRRESVRYSNVLTAALDHGDYALRWQKPGDELHTIVPSLPATSNTARDNLYRYSSVLVEKGDHFRLQDLSLSYDLPRKIASRLRVSQAQIYVYANNLGILWKATKLDLDPDYPTSGTTTVQTTFPVPRSLSVGMKLDL